MQAGTSRFWDSTGIRRAIKRWKLIRREGALYRESESKCASDEARTAGLSGRLPAVSDKGYYPVSRPALPLFRGGEDSLNVKAVLGGFLLAGEPDFIDDGVPGHGLF